MGSLASKTLGLHRMLIWPSLSSWQRPRCFWRPWGPVSLGVQRPENPTSSVPLSPTWMWVAPSPPHVDSLRYPDISERDPPGYEPGNAVRNPTSYVRSEDTWRSRVHADTRRP